MKRTLVLATILLATAPAVADLPEAPSPVNATYVAPSATKELVPGAKIGHLFVLNNTKPYVLQRLTKRTTPRPKYGRGVHV